MGGAVRFPGTVMAVIHPFRGQTVEPLLNVLNESVLCIVHVNPCGDVHRRDEHHPLVDPALPQNLFHLGHDVNKLAMLLGVKPEVLRVGLHLWRQLELKE